MTKHVECSQCNSKNTELEVDTDESIEEGESVHISVWCVNCMTYSPFPLDEDWTEYV